MRDQIFISYSHADSQYQLRLRKHLTIFERAGNIKYWSDTQLRTGEQWRNEIQTNIEKTAVAILLISADFLASDFICSNELPPLLEAWAKNDVYILPVIVKPCSFFHIKELSQFQAVNDPEHTIEEMTSAEQERTWKNLAEAAYERLQEYQQTHCGDTTDTPDLFNAIHMEIQLEEDYDTEESSPDFANPEEHLVFYYIRDLLEAPQKLQGYYVYPYEHIDILNFMPKAIDFLSKYPGYPQLEAAVQQLFRQNGWEGDGEIRLMWFPPFLKIGVEDTWGTLAWFVKQQNNGTSFIASPVPIPQLPPADRILKPNNWGCYTAQIAEARPVGTNYRCFRIRGLLDNIPGYVPGESHWLFYPAGAFTDPQVNDWVKFEVKNICSLRDFRDIKNTRNIYPRSLEVLP